MLILATSPCAVAIRNKAFSLLIVLMSPSSQRHQGSFFMSSLSAVRRRNQAFTLVELLVVIAIIGILVGAVATCCAGSARSSATNVMW